MIIKAIVNRELTILTNDPSMTAWGWCVLRNGEVLGKGAIKTETDGKKRRIRKSDETTQRISEINETLLQIIKHFGVNYLLSEAPHGSQNASAAVMIGAVAAIMQTISDCLKIPIEFYSEQDSKKCLLGKKSATKQETIDAILKRFPSLKLQNIKWRDEAICDALSVYYAATKLSNTLKFLKL